MFCLQSYESFLFPASHIDKMCECSEFVYRIQKYSIQFLGEGYTTCC